MVEILVEKIEKVCVSMEQIEAYMQFKGWAKNPGGGYRSPCGARECIALRSSGERLMVKAIAAFEHRSSYDVVIDILAFSRFERLRAANEK